jgi:hypothetical protein
MAAQPGHQLSLAARLFEEDDPGGLPFAQHKYPGASWNVGAGYQASFMLNEKEKSDVPASLPSGKLTAGYHAKAKAAGHAVATWDRCRSRRVERLRASAFLGDLLQLV